MWTLFAKAILSYRRESNKQPPHGMKGKGKRAKDKGRIPTRPFAPSVLTLRLRRERQFTLEAQRRENIRRKGDLSGVPGLSP
jgi:hypothetical protein